MTSTSPDTPHLPGTSAAADTTTAVSTTASARRFRVWPWVTAFWVLHALANIGRWRFGLVRGYDNGIFQQSAQTWARDGWPVSHYRGLELLGDHFSPIQALIAPLWMIAPSGLTLLLVQTSLFAVGVAVMLREVRHRASHLVPYVGVLSLVTSFLWSATLRDAHEVQWAVPAMAVGVVGMLRGRFRWVLGASVVLLLTKEDLGLTVGAAGMLWWWLHRNVRQALTLMVLGAVGVIVAFVTIGLISGQGSIYLGYLGIGTVSAQAPKAVGTPHPDVFRALPLMLFTLAAGVIGVRQPVCFLAVPTLLWRVTSSRDNFWMPNFHYDAMLWPIATMALVLALTEGRVRRSRWVWAAALIPSLVVTWVCAWGKVPPAGSLERYDVLQQFDRQIPSGVLIADNGTQPYVMRTHDVYPFESEHPSRYVLFTRTGDNSSEPTTCERGRIIAAAQQQGATVTERNGLVLIDYGRERETKRPSC